LNLLCFLAIIEPREIRKMKIDQPPYNYLKLLHKILTLDTID